MALILNDIIMRSTAMVRQAWEHDSFDFGELWQAVEDGSLEEFQKSVLEKCKVPSARSRGEEILLALRVLAGRMSAQVTFLRDGKPDAEGLFACLTAFGGNSEGPDGKTFFSRNETELDRLVNHNIVWNNRKAWTLYLFLLLHLQIRPGDRIRPRDVDFLLGKLSSLPDSETQPEIRQDRLGICRDGYLRCQGREILRLTDETWESVYTDDQELAGFCLMGDQMIVLRTDGTLAPCTPEQIRTAAAGKRILQVSAWGRHYILLCDDGTAVSSVDVRDWKDLRWVNMGINSVSGISGSVKRAVQLGCDETISKFTDVKSVHTYSCDGETHFAVLRENGDLYLDGSANPIPDVTIATMGIRGYLYVSKGCVNFRPYRENSVTMQLPMPEGDEVTELHCRDDLLFCSTADRFVMDELL